VLVAGSAVLLAFLFTMRRRDLPLVLWRALHIASSLGMLCLLFGLAVWLGLRVAAGDPALVGLLIEALAMAAAGACWLLLERRKRKQAITDLRRFFAPPED
jgi:hypothetical protein